MTNTANDLHMERITNMSVLEMRDIILDNPALFPELDGMSEAHITSKLMAERHEMRTNVKPASSVSIVLIVPALLLVGTIVTGILALVYP